MARVSKRKRMLRGELECGYCGKVPADTVDHVVPSCLFERPWPKNIITVPACKPCNNAKAKLDSFLRDFLVCEEGAPANRTADSIRAGPYQRAVGRKQSELWKQIEAGRFERTAVRKDGMDFGVFLKIPFANGPVKEAITYIVRGLHYKVLGARVPPDHSFLVAGMGDRRSCIRMIRQLQSTGPLGGAAIGEPGNFDVFSSFCARWYSEADDEYAASIWGLAFYERMHIACLTMTKGMRDRMNPRILKDYS